VVYDGVSGAAIGRFEEAAGNLGWLAVVAPTGDKVAMGGSNSKVVTLRELEPPALVHRWRAQAVGAGAMLAGAAAAGDVVALAAGNRLELHSFAGVGPPRTLELGAAIGCYSGENNAVAMRPGATHVVCAMRQTLACVSLPSGVEAFTLDRSQLGQSIIGLCRTGLVRFHSPCCSFTICLHISSEIKKS
jgi:hypothetical protein